MSFNTSSCGTTSDLVSTAILNQIHVDGVNVKVLPQGSSPNVVYRIGDGTAHSEGWDNVVGEEYLDFYIANGVDGNIGYVRWIEKPTGLIEGQTVVPLTNDASDANVYLNGSLLDINVDYTVTGTGIVLTEGVTLVPTADTLILTGNDVGGSAPTYEPLGDFVLFVDNIADLAGIDGATDPSIVVMDSVRGGTFNYDVTTIGTDDGGVVLNGWVREYDGVAYAKWFGAVSDGTDQQAELQKALNFAVTNEVELVIDDSYSLSSNLESLDITSLKITGINDARLIALAGFAAEPMLNLYASTDAQVSYRKIEIRDLEFDGENIPNSGVGEANDCLAIGGNKDRLLDEVVVDGCYFYTGDRFEVAGSDSHIIVGGSDKATVENCTFVGAVDSAIYISGSGTLVGDVYTLDAGRNCTVQNNKFEYCNIAIIFKREFEKSVITNNYIDNCEIGIAQGRGDEFQQSGINNIINNNNISRCSTSVIVRQNDGAVVSDNVITQLGYIDNVGGVPSASSVFAIELQGTSNSTVTGNSIVGHNEDITLSTLIDLGAIKLIKRDSDGSTWDCAYNVISSNAMSGLDFFALGVSGEAETYSNRFIGNSVGLNGLDAEIANAYINLADTTTIMGVKSDGSTHTRYGTTNEDTLVTTDGKVGVGTTPTRAFHIANGFANGSTPNAGVTGTDVLIESSGETVVNILTKASSGASHLMFGDEVDGDKNRISYDNTNEYINITSDDIRLNNISAFNPTTVVAKTPVATITTTTETDIYSHSYTVKGNSKKLYIRPTMRCALTTHDDIWIRIYVGATEVGASRYSDSSADNAEFRFDVSNAGYYQTVQNKGDVVTIKLTGQLTVGLSASFNSAHSYLEITEIE